MFVCINFTSILLAVNIHPFSCHSVWPLQTAVTIAPVPLIYHVLAYYSAIIVMISQSAFLNIRCKISDYCSELILNQTKASDQMKRSLLWGNGLDVNKTNGKIHHSNNRNEVYKCAIE